MDKEKKAYPLLLDDGDVAALLAQDAAKLRSRYNAKGMSAYLEPASKLERPSSTRVNTRFLQNTVRNVRGHNSMLAKRDREERLNLKNHPLKHRVKVGTVRPASQDDTRCSDVEPGSYGPTVMKVGEDQILETARDETALSARLKRRRSASPRSRVQQALGHLTYRNSRQAIVETSDKQSRSSRQSKDSHPRSDRERETRVPEDGDASTKYWQCGAGYL
jgi:hypothetical protein